MGITDVLLLSGVFTSALFMVSDGVSLTASLAIQTPSPPYQAGDQLVFSFQCEVTVTADQAYNVRLEFGSERLEFPSDPIENQFAWQYNKVNTPQTVEDRLTFTPTDFDEGVDSENLWLLLIVPADTAASRFVQGTFTMNVPDSIMPSDTISSFLTLSYDDQASGGTTVSSVFKSDESYVENPYFDLSSIAFDAATGVLMNIGDSIDATIVIALPRSIMDQIIEVELPYGSGAMMTLTDDLSMSSFGANLPCSGCVTLNERSSTEGNLEYNFGNAEFSPLPVTTGDITNMANAMTIDFNVRLEDNENISNQTEEWIMAGVMYGRNGSHIWVGQMAVTALVDETERVPYLNTNTQLGSHINGEEVHQGDSVTISVDIWHCGQRDVDTCGGLPSRGLAVDVKVVIILPPYVTFDGVVQWNNLDSEPTAVYIQDTLVQLQLGDISFGYEPHIEFNVTIDPSGMAAGLSGSTFVGLIEVLYSTRDGNLKTTNLEGIDLIYTKTITGNSGATVPSLIQGNTCTCPFDGTNQCACCVSGASRCDNDYHEKCVETFDIVNKCPLSDFYDVGFLLHGSGTSLYACDSSDSKLQNQQEICAVGDMSDNWYGLRKSNVNTLGFHQGTNAVYGINQNTKTYVVREYDSSIWVSIPSQEYDNVKSDSLFKSYQRAATGASMSDGGYTGVAWQLYFNICASYRRPERIMHIDSLMRTVKLIDALMINST
ncbi:uncharacterized protein LOC100377284 [Saccoglossus kowalevskii]